MYGVAGGMLAPEERLLFVELLIATVKLFSKRVQFFEVDW
jgi:hypothetical protein